MGGAGTSVPPLELLVEPLDPDEEEVEEPPLLDPPLELGSPEVPLLDGGLMPDDWPLDVAPDEVELLDDELLLDDEDELLDPLMPDEVPNDEEPPKLDEPPDDDPDEDEAPSPDDPEELDDPPEEELVELLDDELLELDELLVEVLVLPPDVEMVMFVAPPLPPPKNPPKKPGVVVPPRLIGVAKLAGTIVLPATTGISPSGR